MTDTELLDKLQERMDGELSRLSYDVQIGPVFFTLSSGADLRQCMKQGIQDHIARTVARSLK